MGKAHGEASLVFDETADDVLLVGSEAGADRAAAAGTHDDGAPGDPVGERSDPGRTSATGSLLDPTTQDGDRR